MLLLAPEQRACTSSGVGGGGGGSGGPDDPGSGGQALGISGGISGGKGGGDVGGSGGHTARDDELGAALVSALPHCPLLAPMAATPALCRPASPDEPAEAAKGGWSAAVLGLADISQAVCASACI